MNIEFEGKLVGVFTDEFGNCFAKIAHGNEVIRVQIDCNLFNQLKLNTIVRIKITTE